jgi:primosomal protein N' (replication factor Y)
MEGRLIAKVAVATPLSHLDKPFDYLVPDALADFAKPGVRVRVRFAGKLRDGYILGLESSSERAELQPLRDIPSAEPALTPQTVALIRAVADHYAGGFADVVRLAVPPRHAATERATPPDYPAPQLPTDPAEHYLAGFAAYQYGSGYLAAIRNGGAPRAAWTLAPAANLAGDWVEGFLAATQATLLSGRGALLIVPDQHDLDRLCRALTLRFGKGSFVELAAHYGPAARYRRFLAARRGQVRIVVGTRGAIFTPLEDLGLIAVWDDGDDSYAELRAPYPHTREVAALRAHLAKSAVLFAGYARTAEVQELLSRNWLSSIELSPAQARAIAPRILNVSRRPDELPTRLPRAVFELIRSALPAGPVLIQVISEARRTAAELGKAFPGVAVAFSSADHRLSEVSADPQLVLSTPGVEPMAAGGYAAGVLLDADAMLRRADLRVGEESLRRWLAAAALVRAGSAGGSVLIVGSTAERPVQALLKLDVAGFAQRELEDRAAAGLPPAVKMVVIEGSYPALTSVAAELALPTTASKLGPLPTDQPDLYRITLRCPLPAAATLVHTVRVLSSVRTARKADPIRITVDPHLVG